MIDATLFMSIDVISNFDVICHKYSCYFKEVVNLYSTTQ